MEYRIEDALSFEIIYLKLIIMMTKIPANIESVPVTGKKVSCM